MVGLRFPRKPAVTTYATLSIKEQLVFYMHFSQRKDHRVQWTSCGSLVGTENSPNCKCIHHAGSIRHAAGSKTSQLNAPLV